MKLVSYISNILNCYTKQLYSTAKSISYCNIKLLYCTHQLHDDVVGVKQGVLFAGFLFLLFLLGIVGIGLGYDGGQHPQHPHAHSVLIFHESLQLRNFCSFLSTISQTLHQHEDNTLKSVQSKNEHRQIQTNNENLLGRQGMQVIEC